MKRIIFLMAAVSALLPGFRGSANALEPMEIYREKSAAVVLIYAQVTPRLSKGGSGFFIASDGLILTNAHVVTGKDKKPLSKIKVYLKPKRVTGDLKRDLSRRYDARIVNYNRALDIAVLKIDGAPPLRPFVIADSENVEIGQPVVAIGHPEQGGLWTLTTGTVSSRLRNISGVQGKHMFQTEASINHGNSGGPLIDSNGHVVGMNTSTSRKSSDGTAIVGVNFALQSNVLTGWLKRQGIRTAKASLPPAKPAEKRVAQKAPEENSSKPERKVEKTPAEAKIEKTSKKEIKKEGKIVTPKKPYEWDKLEATVAEMEDMMDDMRGKIRETF